MKFKRLKSILSLVLSILILLPSFTVFADTKDILDEVKYEVTDDNIENENLHNEIMVTEDIIQENTQENNQEQEKQDKENYEVINNTEVENELVGEKYEIIENVRPYSISEYMSEIDENMVEREEVKLKYETLYNSKILLNKTDENYEVALAYSDGSYSFVDSANSIEEAKQKILEEEKKKSNVDVIPVILNDNGQVVYSTFSMGRILKHINGVPDSTFGNNTNIYTTSSLSNAYTYVNHGYVDDVPVIEDTGSAAKIQVSGYTGWVNKNVNSLNYDLVIVPINQVTNPSYYMNKGGVLYHFISSDLTNSSEKGNTIKLGVAPSYLKDGVKYLSYDGNYFYDGSNISQGLTNLISDLRNNVKSNSINKNEPYYTYFNYLPFRSTTTYSAEDLNRFISANTDSTSKLINTGQYFINAQATYGVNALLALGVAINESAWGKSNIAQTKNNLFGMNAVDSSPGESANYYKSVELCINEFAKYYISRGYADPADWRYYGGFLGNKINGANVKYASDPFWGEKASAHAFRADLYLSSNDVNNLKDYDSLTVIKYTGENSVIDKNKKLLYNISTSINSYTACINSVSVVTDKNTKLIDGKYYLEIYPERTSYIGTGGSANKFAGEYSFSNKAYVESKNLVFINASKTDILPVDPYSANSWKESNGKKYYYNNNGVLVRGWKAIGNYWYYFDTTTAIMKTGWLSYNGEWYYLNSDGKMATGIINNAGKVYYLDKDGIMQTGWQIISGSKYYFLNDGQAKIGWLLQGDKWYYFNSEGKSVTGLNKINNKLYYFDSNGVMQTGWKLISGTWYYFNSNGDAKIGWLLYKNNWYYLNSEGKMEVGLKEINNKLYYFNSNGVMQTGWKLINGTWYYFNSDGDAKVGWLLYKNSWYYLNLDGKMETGLKQINNKLYYFNNDGVMQIGWIKVSNDWYYFNPTGDAKTGWLLENGKWYYLKNDGKMATGWIEVASKKYYLYSSGVMAYNTTIDGIYLGSDGAAIK